VMDVAKSVPLKEEAQRAIFVLKKKITLCDLARKKTSVSILKEDSGNSYVEVGFDAHTKFEAPPREQNREGETSAQNTL